MVHGANMMPTWVPLVPCTLLSGMLPLYTANSDKLSIHSLAFDGPNHVRYGPISYVRILWGKAVQFQAVDGFPKDSSPGGGWLRRIKKEDLCSVSGAYCQYQIYNRSTSVLLGLFISRIMFTVRVFSYICCSLVMICFDRILQGYFIRIAVNIVEEYNASPSGAAYMRRWTGWKSVQVMVYRLFGAEPLPGPTLIYCRLDRQEQTFHSRKCISKRLRIGSHYVQGDIVMLKHVVVYCSHQIIIRHCMEHIRLTGSYLAWCECEHVSRQYQRIIWKQMFYYFWVGNKDSYMVVEGPVFTYLRRDPYERGSNLTRGMYHPVIRVALLSDSVVRIRRSYVQFTLSAAHIKHVLFLTWCSHISNNNT